MDELLEFLPIFEHPNEAWIEDVRGGEGLPDGVTTTRYPEYREAVVDFFMRAGQPWWSDTGYSPAEAGRMIADDHRIARASLSEIRTMLTYCVRGERFADGHWDRMLRDGRVLALLRRLRELRNRIDPD